MTKRRWEGSLNTFSSYIDPQKEEQLKWLRMGQYSPRHQASLEFQWKIWDSRRMQFKPWLCSGQSHPEHGYLWYREWKLIQQIENTVKRILRLVKSISVDKDTNLKKKSQLIDLNEEFHRQYGSLYCLYKDLRKEVKNSARRGDDNDNDDGSDGASSSSSNSEMYYSPNESSHNVQADEDQDPEMGNGEDYIILKDKLTSSSEVKEAEINEVPKDIVASIQELETELASVRTEVESLSTKRQELEEQVESKTYEASRLRTRVFELEVIWGHNKQRDNHDHTTILSIRNTRSEEQLSREGKGLSSMVDGLKEEVGRVQKELVTTKVENAELEDELKNISADYLKNHSLNSQRIESENQTTINNEACRTEVENDIQSWHRELSALIETLNEKLSNQDNMLERLKKENKYLHQELEASRKDGEQHYKELEQKEQSLISKLHEFEEENRVIFRNVYEEALLVAKDLPVSLDRAAMKLDKCSSNFSNRISKASFELKLARDWSRRKNDELCHIKDAMDEMLSQLNGKKAELLIFSEKASKLENKLRELERMTKEKEDSILGFQEEKREAIRQLCVCIDHHRSWSDYYKKMLSAKNPERRKPS